MNREWNFETFAKYLSRFIQYLMNVILNLSMTNIKYAKTNKIESPGWGWIDPSENLRG